jgi:prophage maintenance system killer protein
MPARVVLLNGIRIVVDPIAYADQVLAVANRGDARLESAIVQLAQWLRAHTETIS